MIKLKQSVEGLVKLSFSILFTVSIVVSIGSFYYSTEMMEWLYPQHAGEILADYSTRIDESATIFSLLMFGFVAVSSVYVFSTLLTANGSLKQLNLIAASGVLISLLLNFTLVPRMQAIGSAYASLSAQFSTALAQFIIASILFRFRANFRFITILLLFIGGVVGIALFTKQLQFDWKLNLLIMISFSTLLAFILRLLNLKEFISIIKSEKG
jgi:O-antigen/teichoic acid export membrane protein